MCGIVAYVGEPARTLDVLLEGLSNLEYRGYDSAGIALDGDGLSVLKQDGDIERLRQTVEEAPQPPTGRLGIGHTRWSTHGPPTTYNAHPHVDCPGTVAVVHNGIITNFEALREELAARGHTFTSDTDTEVIPHLIEHYRREGAGVEDAFRQAVGRLEGSYAICCIVSGYDAVLAARSGSPLVIGVGEGAHFVASDVPAFLAHTDRVVYLEDGQVARLTRSSWTVTDLDGRELDPPVESVPWDPEQTEKDGYDHYMLKEIHEQPRSLRRCIQGRVDELTERISLAEVDDLGPMESVHFVACGTSFHAAMYVARLFNEVGIAARAHLASEFADSPPPLDVGTLVVGITQSGETADTLEALREARHRSAPTLAITNVVASTAARECRHAIFTRAGPEIGVAATKTFSSQIVTALLFLVVTTGTTPRGCDLDTLINALRELPDAVQQILDESSAKEVAERFIEAESYFFIGRGLNYPVALEGALKMKEITYCHAEGFAAGELKHGPLALVTERTPVLATVVGGGTDSQKTIGNVKEVESREAPIIAVTDGTTDVDRYADAVLEVPGTVRPIAPLLANVQYQLLAYHTASLLNRTIDKPRNLAKSVTVE